MADTKIKVSDDPEDILQEISANLPKKRLNIKGDVGIPYEAYKAPGATGIKSVVPIAGGELRGSYEDIKGVPTVKIGAAKSFGDLNVSADAIREGVRNSLKARADMPVGEGRGYLEGQYNPDATSYRAGVGMPLYGGDFSAGAQRIVPREGVPMNQLNLMYQRKFASGGSVPQMNGIARSLAAQGRNGDDILVHMSRKELRGIASLAPGGLTTNPHTGLPEAFNLMKSRYLPQIAAVGSQFLFPGNPYAAAAAASLTSLAQGNSLQQGLTQGAMAGAGVGVTSGLENAGVTSTAAADATAKAANAAGQTAAQNLTAEGFINTSPVTGGVSGSAAPDLIPAATTNAASTANGITSQAGTSYPIPSPTNVASVPVSTPSALDAGMNTYNLPTPPEGFTNEKYLEILKRQAIDEAGGATPRVANTLFGSERLGNIAAGASDPATLQKVLLSKQGAMLGLAALGASGVLEPKVQKPPERTINYRAVPAYDRKVSFTPANYDRRKGEWNYFPGDRYSAAAGGQVPSPAMPIDLSQNYPGSNITKSSYASLPSTDSQEIVDGYGPKINPFTGAEGMAAGGIATFDQGGDVSRIREIRRSYSSRAQAEKDAMRGGDVAKRLGLSGAEDPVLNYAFGPRQHLDGQGDGMSDSIPATIEGQQPARLSKDEFVIPADVVSHLGNGSSEAGADKLYKMLDNVRQARTGNKKQGKQIVPEKYLPA